MIGRETERIELGTAVVPTYPRHPVTMAQQALTVQAASRGRFTLGIGLSHKFVIEDMWGMSFEHPARHMRDYLDALLPLLQGAETSVENESYRVHATYSVPGADPVPVLIAAMGERMLGLAGAVADGTSLWMTGPDTIESYIAPTLREAAERAGREMPRIVAAFPIAVTDDPDAARAVVGKMLRGYSPIPSYRAMLDREGAAGPEDVAILGDERALDEALDRLEAMGVSDFSRFDHAGGPRGGGADDRVPDLAARSRVAADNAFQGCRELRRGGRGGRGWLEHPRGRLRRAGHTPTTSSAPSTSRARPNSRLSRTARACRAMTA